METVEYTNPLKMAEILHKKTAYTAAYTHYVSILYHCLLIPSENKRILPNPELSLSLACVLTKTFYS